VRRSRSRAGHACAAPRRFSPLGEQPLQESCVLRPEFTDIEQLTSSAGLGSDILAQR
jgi:hypothetical protein